MAVIVYVPTSDFTSISCQTLKQMLCHLKPVAVNLEQTVSLK
jgi:hypothetical protein